MTIKQLEKKLKSENRSTFPKIRTNNIFLNERESFNKKDSELIDKFYGKDNLYLLLPYKSVPVSKIVPTQINVTFDNLKQVFTVEQETGAILLKKDGMYYVVDGHHRISVNILRQANKVKAYIIDEDVLSS